jgi:hypothetical protein
VSHQYSDATHQVMGGSGHKGSRSLRTRRLGVWQQAVEFGGFGARGVSQMVAQLARGLHRELKPIQRLRFFIAMVRDQEVEGSNPFAPTTLLESATYITRISEERLVGKPSPLVSYPSYARALSPLSSWPSNRRVALLRVRFLGN